MFLIIVNVLGHLKGVGGLTSNFLHGGGMDVFWNDPISFCFILSIKNYVMQKSTDLRKMFVKFDSNNDGEISGKEFRKVRNLCRFCWADSSCLHLAMTGERWGLPPLQ